MAGSVALVLATVAFSAIGATPAFADPTAPPPFSSLKSPCPGAQNPTAGSSTFTPYEVPFRAIIFGGQITIPPDIIIPHLFATACGTVQLPQLTGTITSSNIVLAEPNVYINCEPPTHTGNCLEDLPVQVSFGALKAGISVIPAHNGGLDITVTGSTQASVSTLGFMCGLGLNATFTTDTANLPPPESGVGQPVTGPTEQGQAVVFSNTFTVPAAVGSNTGLCPPAVAQTFNRVLGLPAAAGRGTFVAPFCFDFELEHTTIPPRTASCPWPQS